MKKFNSRTFFTASRKKIEKRLIFGIPHIFMCHILSGSRYKKKFMSQPGSIFNFRGGCHIKKINSRILFFTTQYLHYLGVQTCIFLKIRDIQVVFVHFLILRSHRITLRCLKFYYRTPQGKIEGPYSDFDRYMTFLCIFKSTISHQVFRKKPPCDPSKLITIYNLLNEYNLK